MYLNCPLIANLRVILYCEFYHLPPLYLHDLSNFLSLKTYKCEGFLSDYCMGVDYDTQTFKKWVEGILTGPKVTSFCLDEGLSHNTMTRVVLFKQRMWPAIYLLFQGPPYGSS